MSAQNSHAPLEALLRPPIELWSASVAWAIALVALTAPWALMMTPALGLAAGVLCSFFGCVRASQALKVIRYQRGLKFSRVERMPIEKLPQLGHELFLGYGFEWTQQNTQRNIDAKRQDAKAYAHPTRSELGLSRAGAKLLAAAEPKAVNAQDNAQGNAQSNGSKRSIRSRLARALVHTGGPLNPLYPHVDLGGSSALHGTGAGRESAVTLRQSARNGHLLVMGTTRVGKTRLLELLATQDIRSGHTTIVIDPKGDADLMLRLFAEASRVGRGAQFYLFHLGYPEISARYNGIGNFSRITEVASRATNNLPSQGNSAAFKEFSWRFSNIVAQAQVALGRIPTYETLLHDVTGIEPLFMEYAQMLFEKFARQGQFSDYKEQLANIEQQIRRKKISVDKPIATRSSDVVAMITFIKKVKIKDTVLLGLLGAVSYDRFFYERIIASLGPFLEKLTSGAVGKLISPDYFDASDTRPIFDWLGVMRQGAVVYCGLDALSDAVVSSAVGNSMLADLASVGGKLYKTGLQGTQDKLELPTVCCHFDEVNEIAGPEFIPLVNKLGGAGFRITAYTQSSFDIEARMGDRAKAGQVFDNFNHLVMMRVRSVATANLLAEQVPQVDTYCLTPLSGVTDSAAQGTGVDFTSRNDDILTTVKVPLIDPSDLLELPQGEAFALLEGNRRYKLRIPIIDSTGDPFVPASIMKVAKSMKERYRTSEHWGGELDWLTEHPLQNSIPGGEGATGQAQGEVLGPWLEGALNPEHTAHQGADLQSPRQEHTQAQDSFAPVLGQSAVIGNVFGGDRL